MKNITLSFIRLHYSYKHSSSAYGYSECPTKWLGDLQAEETIFNSSDIPEELYKTLKSFARRTNEFVQPCFSNELTGKELLAHIEELSGMWYFFAYEGGLLHFYYRDDNRDKEFKEKVIYPWYINKDTLKRFRRIAKYGSFILGVDRLAFGDIFGNKIYRYL